MNREEHEDIEEKTAAGLSITAEAGPEGQDFEPEHPPHILKEKIRMLEEELVRKDDMIQQLIKDNDILFKTAVKNSEKQVERLKAKKEE